MKRCPSCLTRFDADDYAYHMDAHNALTPFSAQRNYEMRAAIIAEKTSTHHKPTESCDCVFVGARNYCEALRPEAI